MSMLGPSRGLKNERDVFTIRRIPSIKSRANLEHEANQNANNNVRPVLQHTKTLTDYLLSQQVISKMSGKDQTVSISRALNRSASKQIQPEKPQPKTPIELPTSKQKSLEYWLERIQCEAHKQNGFNNNGAFVYLKIKDISDPYNVEYCDYSEIEKANGRYYTLSAQGFTSYVKYYADDFITIQHWIDEKKMFEMIKGVSIFKLFKAWKRMKVWRHNVIVETRKEAKRQLEKKLIVTKSGFIQTLLIHKKNCRNMENQMLFEIADPDAPLSLEEFKKYQDNHHKLITEKIVQGGRYTNKMMLEVVNKSMDEMKKIIRENKDENQKTQEKDEPISELDSKNVNAQNRQVMSRKKPRAQQDDNIIEADEPYINLGFPSNLSYTNRAEVRKHCKMLLRFSRLLDYMAQTSLCDLYCKSMNSLEEYFNKKNLFILPKELPPLKANGGFTPENAQKPILELNIDLGEANSVPENFIVEEFCDSFEPHPVGKHTINTFDPTVHLEQICEENKFAINRKLKCKTVKNIEEALLHINPNILEIAEVIENLMKMMLVSLSKYEKHCNNEDMELFLDVVPSFIGEGDGISKKRKKGKIVDKNLYCEKILENINEYQLREKYLCDFIGGVQQNIKNYLNLLYPYLLRYWKYSRIPWENIKSDKLRFPVECLSLFISQVRETKEQILQKIPVNADIGFTKIYLGKMRDKLSKTQINCLKKLDEVIVFFSKK